MAEELKPLIGLAAELAKKYGIPAEVIETILIDFITSLLHGMKPDVTGIYLKFDKEWPDRG